jgi:hypothetical protein
VRILGVKDTNRLEELARVDSLLAMDGGSIYAYPPIYVGGWQCRHSVRVGPNMAIK